MDMKLCDCGYGSSYKRMACCKCGKPFVSVANSMKMQVLEANRWVDVHTRCQTEAGMKRIYKSFLKDNPLPHKAAEPVCGMRIITIHFEHLGAFPRKQSRPTPTHTEMAKEI